MKKAIFFIIASFLFACTPEKQSFNDGLEVPPCEYVEYRQYIEPFPDSSEFSPQMLFDAMQARRIDYPEVFTQIAIQESGWELKPTFRNNFFGFKCNLKSAFVCGCSGEYSEFRTPEHTFAFLKEWIAYDPPKGDINAYQWLQRRGFNTDPAYYETIKKHDFWSKVD